MGHRRRGGPADINLIPPRSIAENLWLLPGDLGLSRFEERLSQEWPATLAGGSNAAVRTTSALHRLTRHAASAVRAEIVLIDVGPSLGALNRAALLTAEHVLIPLGADLFSVQGLCDLGPALRRWRGDWQATALPRVAPELRQDVPAGDGLPTVAGAYPRGLRRQHARPWGAARGRPADRDGPQLPEPHAVGT